MSSISSLSRVASGLIVSQRGLEVTGHNIANANSIGYVRQQVLQNDSFYQTIGRNGNDLLSLGAGSDITEIRQIRDEFLDKAYRNQICSKEFYEVQYNAAMEIETIMGEVDGESFSSVLRDFWNQLQNLSIAPQDQGTRTQFIQSASVLVDKINYINDKLIEYQNNLNNQVVETVDRINEIAEEIRDLNEQIVKYEISGDNANDLRDRRNVLLDELSQYIDISYKEDQAGRVNVSAEGYPLVSEQSVYKITLTQADPNSKSPFLKPVWEHTGDDVIRFNKPIGSEFGNDTGKLKALLLTRGDRYGNYLDTETASAYEDIEPYFIPRVQAEFDTLVHDLVTTINDILAPQIQSSDSPQGLDGTQHVELFKRKYMDRYDGSGTYQVEDPNDPNTLYSAGNIEINPILLDEDGYNKLCLSSDGSVGDTKIIQEILDAWQEPNTTYDQTSAHKLNFEDYYSEFITRIAEVGNKASQKVEEKEIVVNSIDNSRSSISGVSTDEEMTNLMKYQHAYNASARMVSIIDSMLDTVINRTGIAGR
ncbi:flagellar hook-associated protein FlgK [Defluviitalea phaphyphila]|uniref:flagellar hook-associated protein FlgK n=1 Tax=Defluviitalea phaphyphila TaxID=1473580 RepID=UPI00072FD62F|nr:flagellar hook-associated protein FlgK [Defluviitalea phaphyphila]